MKKTKRTPAKAIAEHNTATHDLLVAIKASLPGCGPEATWEQAGTAEQVHLKLYELASWLGVKLEGPRTYSVVRGDGTRVNVTVPE